jgi:two-component system, OmpR family, sensor histidine kinase TctE
VRIASVGRLISTEAGTGWVTIRVAETRGARAALAAEIFGNAVVPVGVLTILALGTVWVVVGRAFAPLAVIDASCGSAATTTCRRSRRRSRSRCSVSSRG